MKYLRLIVSIGVLFTHFTLFAQEPLVLALPDTSANSGDTLRLDITARQFTDIVSFQFSLKWDAQVLQYAGSEMTDLPGVAVGTSGATTGVLRFSWFDIQGNGQTLSDGSSIIRLKFFVNGSTGDFTDLLFTNMPINIQVFRSDGAGGFQAATMNPENGLVTIGESNIFRANFNITNVACNGSNTGIISSSLINTPPGATIRWTGPNNFQSQQEDLTGLAAGIYNLQIINAGNILLDTTFTILQPPTALAIDTITTVQASCSQATGSATVVASGGTSPYRYSIGSNFLVSNQFNNLATGLYTLTVRDSNNCTISDTFQIQAPGTPQINLPATIAICNNQDTILDAGEHTSYQWSTGATTRTITVSNPGTYSVIVSDGMDCSAADSVQVISGSALPIPLADTVSICNGQTTTLDAGAYASYLWSTGVTSRSISVSNTGIYGVTVTDAGGCTASDSVRVLTGNAPLINLADSIAICNSQNTALDAGVHTSYLWSTGAMSRAISVSTAGTYSVTVTNAAGCTAADSIQVQAVAAPMVELGDTTFICNGENVMLDAGEHTTYRWSNGIMTRSITVSTAGNFSVTVTNAAGCNASDTIQVLAETSFEARIENDTLTICPGTNLQLRASLADTYQWIDTSKTLSAVNIRNPIAQPKVTTGYTLIAANSCGIDTVQVELTVLEVTATAGPDTCIAPGDELELYASGGVTYFWFLTEYPVSNPNIPNPTTQPEDSTNYFVMITDVNGCQKLDTINVMVANNPLDITAVNMITPNGDGKNDVLEFSGLAKFGINTLKIYNRWGDQVYQKINYQRDEERFDGTRNGKPLPAGNYFYVLSFRTGDIKQTLTIVRE